MSTLSQFKILFTGYAPVHFVCFRPLYEQLLAQGADVYVSGGLRSQTGANMSYDARALYDPFQVPSERVLSVDESQQHDFDVLFAANTKMISPRSVRKRVQLFHGISFRNRSVRDDQKGTDNYFLIGPYMHRKFVDHGLLDEQDSRGLKIGFLKTDRLLNGRLDRQEILQRHGFDGSRPVVLYAPTGEKHNSLETMGEEVIRQLSKCDQFDVIIKLHDHPKNKATDWPTRLREMENEHIKVSREMDVVPLLIAADLLISDASSVSNEFSLLNRPMVFLDVPKLLARARKRSNSALDLDTWGRRGGPVVKSSEDVVQQVDDELQHPERHEEVRRQMAADLFYNPGQATETAVNWLQETLA
jgi:hypothetical protein